MKRTGRRAPRVPAATLLLASSALLVTLTPGGAMAAELDRALLDLEPWRLLTGHLAHFGASHFVYDTIVLLALGTFAEVRWPRATRLALGLSAVLIPLVLLLAMPALATYRGLSGLDSTLFAVLVTRLHVERAFSTRLSRWLPAIAGLGFLAKLVFELATRTTLFVEPSALFAPVPLAHLVGATLGLAVALLPMSCTDVDSEDSECGGLVTREPKLRT
jgi:rhomboid family GlyGly-CTERM serine protease